jgi:hypothetical protein
MEVERFIFRIAALRTIRVPGFIRYPGYLNISIKRSAIMSSMNNRNIWGSKKTAPPALIGIENDQVVNPAGRRNA